MGDINMPVVMRRQWLLKVFWFSVKMRPSSGRRREIPPCGRGFSRHEDLNDPMVFYWAA
jgi:hypothetical protein